LTANTHIQYTANISHSRSMFGMAITTAFLKSSVLSIVVFFQHTESII